jgi:type I restriction enzyme M protein
MPRPTNSEVDAYVFIKETLESLGWNPKNPSRDAAGEVYTQGECLTHAEIKRALNLDKPENIVKVTETCVWVIEAKREHRQLTQALGEAEDYATRINQTQLEAVLATGVAGNRTDSYLIKTTYYDGRAFQPVTINGKEVSGLLSPEEAREIVANSNPNLEDVKVDENLFLQKAERINQILHNGAINKNQRARVMAALLLALVDETPPNIDANPRGLMRDINARVANVLEEQGKPEFFDLVKITLPPSSDNHVKYKKALVETIQELNLLQIRSAMNSGTDVLGKFYEVFLKYGNGAKEIGIVLTPRHVTKFAVEAVGIGTNDIVFDPTCGTAGFLVAAFDHVKRHSNTAQIDRFKQNNLFGVEQEPEVVALAIVNMIFRGDGKNNIVEGNCFQKHLRQATVRGVATAKFGAQPATGHEAVTRVLMNPPFALKTSDEKEYKFIDYALSQMQDGCLLFSVLPYSAMVKGSGYLLWRKQLLQHHTFVSVVTFPDDLFYPVGVHSVGIFIRKGVPHDEAKNVLWIRAIHDGYIKSKGKRLKSDGEADEIERALPVVQGFIVNDTVRVQNISKVQKAVPINFGDTLVELAPEAYLDQDEPTPEEVREEIEKVLRETTAFLIKQEGIL